jgi:WD40 repeat protein
LITPEDHLLLIIHLGQTEDKHDYRVIEYDLAMPSSPLQEYSFSSGYMISATISSSKESNKKYLCIGQLYKINTYVIESEKLKLYNSQLYHDQEVYRLCLTPNNLFLFSAGQEGVIKKIDTIKMADSSQKNVLCRITDHNGTVHHMTCTSDSSKLIILSDNSLIIWSINQESLIKRIYMNYTAKSIVLSKLYPFFYLKRDESIEIWSFQDFEFKTRLEYSNLQTFCFFNQERKIAIKYSSKTEFFESPLYSKHVKLIGEQISEYSKDFFKYVNDIVAGKNVYYDDRFKNWIVMPFMMNIQHIYAYYNYDDLLRCAFIKETPYQDSNKNELRSEGNAPYLKSFKGHTALSIALEQDFPACSKIALKCMKSRWESNPYSLITVSDSLIALNNAGIDGLQKLYDFALRRHFFQTLPSFCSTVSLPVIKYSESIEVDYDVMLGLGANTKDGTALAFDHSCFKVIMGLGSVEGIDFLESLINSPNERIFETRLIKLILNEKWKKARYVMYLQASLYVGFIISLAVYSTEHLESKGFLWIPFAFNICLLLYEIYQMFAGGIDYFKDFWNYVDMVRSSLFSIYAIMVWVDYFKNHTDFLALVILITWIRGVTYFRIFDSTRYLINLLFEVFRDIPSFLIIFFYTILAFSFIFYALDSSGDYYPTFVSTYSTTLGNSNTDNYDKLQWLFYLFITLFNFIIMLNLLISILSDTYARVNEYQIIADGKELANMIMEVELMLFWRKKMDTKEFIHVCRDESDEDIGDTVKNLGKFKAMNQAMTGYEQKIEDAEMKLRNLKDEIAHENDIFKGMIERTMEKFRLKK